MLANSLPQSLLDVEMVAEEPGLRQTAMVSLASFFRMTRIDRLASETRFPIAQLNMTGQETDWPSRLVSRVSSFLHPDGDNVTAGDRSAALSALNILGHPSLIHAVLPLVEGRVRFPKILSGIHVPLCSIFKFSAGFLKNPTWIFMESFMILRDPFSLLKFLQVSVGLL